jgi:hypothetical protein
MDEESKRQCLHPLFVNGVCPGCGYSPRNEFAKRLVVTLNKPGLNLQKLVRK